MLSAPTLIWAHIIYILKNRDKWEAFQQEHTFCMIQFMYIIFYPLIYLRPDISSWMFVEITNGSHKFNKKDTIKIIEFTLDTCIASLICCVNSQA